MYHTEPPTDNTPRPLVQKKTWRDSQPIDMLLSAVSVLVVAQSSSEIPEVLINNPVWLATTTCFGASWWPSLGCALIKVN